MDNKENGLCCHLFLCKGSYVILKNNIWQISGLCNGTTVHVVDVIYSDDKPSPGPSDFFIVDFDNNYSGPPLIGNDQDRKGWVPFSTDNYEWKTSSVDSQYVTETSTPTMIPIRLCYSWKIWKAQGKTITSKIIFYPGHTKRERGLN